MDTLSKSITYENLFLQKFTFTLKTCYLTLANSLDRI